MEEDPEANPEQKKRNEGGTLIPDLKLYHRAIVTKPAQSVLA